MSSGGDELLVKRHSDRLTSQRRALRYNSIQCSHAHAATVNHHRKVWNTVDGCYTYFETGLTRAGADGLVAASNGGVDALLKIRNGKNRIAIGA